MKDLEIACCGDKKSKLGLAWKLSNPDTENFRLLNNFSFLASDVVRLIQMEKPDKFTELTKRYLVQKSDQILLRYLAINLNNTAGNNICLEVLAKRLDVNYIQAQQEIVQEQLKWMLDKDLCNLIKQIDLYEESDVEILAQRSAMLELEKYKDWIKDRLKKFEAELRFHWKDKVLEWKQKAINKDKIISKLIRDNITNQHSKLMLKRVKFYLSNIAFKCTKLAKDIFSRKHFYGLKKKMNMTLAAIRKFERYADKKKFDVELDEEIQQLEMDEMIKDKSFWYPMIMEQINKNKNWKKLYEKIPLEMQPNIMKKFVEDLPKMEKIKDYEEFFNKKIDKLYEENIKRISTTDASKELNEDEFEEIEDEDEPKPANINQEALASKSRIKNKKKISGKEKG